MKRCAKVAMCLPSPSRTAIPDSIRYARYSVSGHACLQAIPSYEMQMIPTQPNRLSKDLADEKKSCNYPE